MNRDLVLAPRDLQVDQVTQRFRFPRLMVRQQLLPHCVSTRVRWVHRGREAERVAPRLLRRPIQYGLFSVSHIGHQ